MSGPRNIATWLALNADYSCSLNGADSRLIYRTLLNISRKTHIGGFHFSLTNICTYHKLNMKNLLLIFFFLVFVSFTQNCFSQTFHTTSNKALKMYNEGVSEYD